MGIKLIICSSTMKACVVIIILLIPFLGLAQDTSSDLLVKDSVLLNQEKKSFGRELAGFLETSWEIGSLPYDSKISHLIGAGILYEGFSAGFFIITNSGKLDDDPFTPRDYNLPFQMTGGFLGKSLYRGEKFQLYSRLNMSQGIITWRDQESNIDVFDDNFLVIKPELQFSFLPIRFIQIFASAGYRKTYKLDLTQVRASDFEGTTFNIGIRLGYFYKPKSK